MRFRLQPTLSQEAALLEHCAHARFVWDLAVEQHQRWRSGREGPPGYAEQSRQLTEARKEFGWLAAGSQTVQQQVLRDFAQALSNFFSGTHRRPTWRKAGRHEGFRIVGRRGDHWDVGRLSRDVGVVRVPKIGWVRESQAVFRCCACGHTDHADVNAAKNIAAGRAVTARGGRPLGGPVNREPQLVPSSA